MLAVSGVTGFPTRSNDEEQTMDISSFSIDPDDFPEFSDHNNLLEGIDFDDLFDGIDVSNDVLPDLEMDSVDILGDFSISGGEESDVNYSSPTSNEEQQERVINGSEEIVSSKREVEKEGVVEVVKTVSFGSKDGEKREKGRKSSGQSKHNNGNNNNQGKRKVKVDWTPELHRRFVQAVEQLGVDKAVPSRILELMGIDCLTRHNIASHLQKYRSHRKHLLAREAEAASMSHRRQMYGAAAVAGGGKVKRDINPWIAPTIGFPPVTPMHHHHPPPPPPNHHFRPLHVWGHPSIDQPLMHMWPKHLPTHSQALTPSPPPPSHPPHPLTWSAPPPDPTYWRHHHHPQVMNQGGLTSGTPCFPQQLAPTRFAPTHVSGILPHHAMYKVDPGMGVSTVQSSPPLVDLQPSKESIDAALGDVLSKPWLPLPLGLKPPALDSVMVELHRQGVSKIPPTTTIAA